MLLLPKQPPPHKQNMEPNGQFELKIFEFYRKLTSECLPVGSMLGENKMPFFPNFISQSFTLESIAETNPFFPVK